MLVKTLLTDALTPDKHVAGAKRAAIELQQLMIDMPRLNLDVDISVKGNEVFVKYTDGKHVMGTVKLWARSAACAWTIDEPFLWSGSTFDGSAPLILYNMIQKHCFYKYFEQKLVSAFGNASLEFKPVSKNNSTDAAWWQVSPSFNLPNMRVDSGLIQFLVVRLTDKSEVRLTIMDAHGDYHDLEPFPNIHAAQLDLERFLKSVDPEIQDHHMGFTPRARRTRDIA